MSDNKLENVKVGDSVILYRGALKDIRKVEGVHKQHVIVDGIRFRKQSGFRAGKPSRFGGPWIRVPEPGDIERIQAEEEQCRLVGTMRNLNWGQVSIDKLKRIKAILDEPSTPTQTIY